MAERVIPGRRQLERWIDAGLTQEQMADRVHELTGETVTRAGISAAITREGLASREVPRYHDEIPWRVRTEHLRSYPVRMLRLLGRRNSGGDLNHDEELRLDRWLSKLSADGLVVAYDPDSPAGFLYVDRIPDDPADLPIRPRRVWLNPPGTEPEDQ